MTGSTLRVVARLKAKSETVGAVRELLSGLIEPTHREAGCITYQLLQNTDDETDFTFVEEWKSRESFEAHLASDHLQKALPQLEGVLADPPDIRTYTVLG